MLRAWVVADCEARVPSLRAQLSGSLRRLTDQEIAGTDSVPVCGPPTPAILRAGA
jgi:hypothetical protein